MEKIRILHLEDSWADAFLVNEALKKDRVDTEIVVAHGEVEFLAAIAMQKPHLILLDNGVPGFSGTAALDTAHNLIPNVPVVIVSGSADERKISERLKSGPYHYVSKDQLGRLSAVVRRAVSGADNKKADSSPSAGDPYCLRPGVASGLDQK